MNNLHRAVAVNQDSELGQLFISKAAKKLNLRDNRDIHDLSIFYCLLCSAGTNKNSDHFDPVELYKARNSPTDKPVNVGHNQQIIRGHMIDTIAVGEDLKPLPDNLEDQDIPDKLHLITACVIYKYWEDPVVQAEVNELIDKIAKGQTFVSMECLFSDFSLLLTNASTGEQKIIPRNEKTAGLVKYLRQYKGPGKLYNYTLARLLRNITFSAVGIVDNPANPQSIISADLDLFTSQAGLLLENANENVYINLESRVKGENIMSEKTEKVEANDGTVPAPRVEDHPTYQALHNEHVALKHQHQSLQDDHGRLKKDHDHLHKKVEDLNSKLDAIHQKTMAEKAAAKEKENAMAETANDDVMKELAELKDKVASLTTAHETLTARASELEAEKTELTKANDALNATLDEFKKASRHNLRTEALMTADKSLTKENALATAKKFDDLSDDAFAGMVDILKGYASRAPKEVTAEEVIKNAKAEEDAQYGATPENELNKTSADIKNWLTSSKLNSKEKK